MHRHVILAPPRVCASADLELAHQQMQRHRACRIERCGWKWVAYSTLVQSGRIVPQRFSPRERAHRRGIAFPLDHSGRGPALEGTPEVATFQQVLDGLAQLALSPAGADNGCAVEGEQPWASGR
ncbi:hypothetical protein [Nocardia sputorum]|uniref:Uncharacterized protein n=1 Tax=Nocardia sputorum TaxID=2984338 RepID=A0ABM8D5U2_9NOCA|nr:hypothetical protein [Nocardia sputorum]BDT93872.1 hypothetical protein IFM12275_38480 [Nocardia sputorum]BDU02791.1 hypothetical protein IFM12276_58190 [Nocardia sputorum]